MPGLSSSYPQYASVEDLEAYVGQSVTRAEALLQRASGVIRTMTTTALYRVGDDGFTPSDERLANAFHDATILQAAGFVRAGIGPDDLLAAGTTPAIVSKSLGGRSVTYAVDASAASARAELLQGALTPEAAFVLSSNGLLGPGVHVRGVGGDYDLLLRRWVG